MGSCGGNNQFSFNARFVSNSGFTQISGGDNCGPAFCPPQIVFAEPFCDDRPQAVIDAFDLAQGNASASEIVGVDLNAPQGRPYNNPYDRYQTNNPWLDDVLNTAHPQPRRDLGGQMVLQSQQMMQPMIQMMQQMMQMFMQLMSMLGLGGQQQGQLQAQQQQLSQQQQEQQLREQNQQTIQQLQQRIAEIAAAMSQLTQAGGANGQNAQALSALQAENQQLRDQLAALQQGQQVSAPAAVAAPAPQPAPVPAAVQPAPVPVAAPAPQPAPAPAAVQPAPVQVAPAPQPAPVPAAVPPAPAAVAASAPAATPVTVSQADVEAAQARANQLQSQLPNLLVDAQTARIGVARFNAAQSVSGQADRQALADSALDTFFATRAKGNGGQAYNEDQLRNFYNGVATLERINLLGDLADPNMLANKTRAEQQLKSMGFDVDRFNSQTPAQQRAMSATLLNIWTKNSADKSVIRDAVRTQLERDSKPLTGNELQADALRQAYINSNQEAATAQQNATQLRTQRQQELTNQFNASATQPYSQSSNRDADIKASIDVYNAALNQYTRQKGKNQIFNAEEFGNIYSSMNNLITGADQATIDAAKQQLTEYGFNINTLSAMNPQQINTLLLTLKAIQESKTQDGTLKQTRQFNESDVRNRLYQQILVPQK